VPRLMMFAACEKVIIATEDNSGSVISILQGFDIPAPPEIKADAPPLVLPLVWYVFTLWEAPNDGPFQYTQRIQFHDPDGLVLFSSEVPIINPPDVGKRFHRAVLKRHGFLFRGAGDYMLRLSLKSPGGEYVDFDDRAFPIPITIKTP
jgi:hypothetical protein